MKKFQWMKRAANCSNVHDPLLACGAHSPKAAVRVALTTCWETRSSMEKLVVAATVCALFALSHQVRTPRPANTCVPVALNATAGTPGSLPEEVCVRGDQLREGLSAPQTWQCGGQSSPMQQRRHPTDGKTRGSSLFRWSRMLRSYRRFDLIEVQLDVSIFTPWWQIKKWCFFPLELRGYHG